MNETDHKIEYMDFSLEMHNRAKKIVEGLIADFKPNESLGILVSAMANVMINTEGIKNTEQAERIIEKVKFDILRMYKQFKSVKESSKN